MSRNDPSTLTAAQRAKNVEQAKVKRWSFCQSDSYRLPSHCWLESRYPSASAGSASPPFTATMLSCLCVLMCTVFCTAIFFRNVLEAFVLPDCILRHSFRSLYFAFLPFRFVLIP